MGDNNISYSEEPFPRYESAFLESEFNYPAMEVEAQFFCGADQTGDEYSSVIFESNVESSFVSALETERSGFGNVVEVGGQAYALQIRIFVSKDDSYLSRVFNKTEPAENEICLFVEDNSTDLLSPRSYYLKTGKVFQKYLEMNQGDDAILAAMNEAKDHIIDGDASVEASFSKEELLTLIKEGSLSGISIVTPFLNVFKTITSWSGWLNDKIGSAILFASETVKYYMKFADSSWDPEADNSDGTSFHPVLIPGLVGIAQEKILSTFESSLNAHATSVIGYLDILASIDFSFVPKGFQDFFKSFQKMVSELKVVAKSFAEVIIKDLVKMLDFFQGFGNRVLNIINAYYCGLWNSLIDVLMGIPDILGYMYKLAALPSKIAQDIDTLVPKIMELMDETLQMVFTTNWPEMIRTIIWESGKGLVSLLSSAGGYLSWERVAYFLGAVTGFIVENLIGFLLSAGVINVASITTKLGKFGKLAKIIADFISALNKAIDGVSEAIFKGIIRVVGWLISIIKKGAMEVKVLIRTLFSKIRSAIKIADDVIEALFKELGLTKVHLSRLRAAGFDVIEVAEDGTEGLIKKICT